MICGNDPGAPLTPGDRAMIAWFREWLGWSKTSEAGRGPELACPDGYAINAAQPRAAGHDPENHT